MEEPAFHTHVGARARHRKLETYILRWSGFHLHIPDSAARGQQCEEGQIFCIGLSFYIHVSAVNREDNKCSFSKLTAVSLPLSDTSSRLPSLKNTKTATPTLSLKVGRPDGTSELERRAGFQRLVPKVRRLCLSEPLLPRKTTARSTETEPWLQPVLRALAHALRGHFACCTALFLCKNHRRRVHSNMGFVL